MMLAHFTQNMITDTKNLALVWSLYCR